MIALESTTCIIVTLLSIYSKIARGEYAGMLLGFYTLIGSTCMMLGIAMCYAQTGTIATQQLSQLRLPSAIHKPIILFLMLGCCTKLPLFPAQG
jgi:NADH:ubiquinone oxidoreductase subunit 4 (subunit M)